MARRLKHAQKSRNSLHVLFKIFLCVLIGFGVVAFVKQEIAIYQIKQELEATQKRLAVLNQQKAELEAERKRLDDPKYIEKLARDDYNMVGPNEVSLFVVDKEKKQ